ncbi:hypothetical protein DPMN_139264 [Dreissena polymorpha]|uniref:Uncharacterized protein n=1 Tax=Dreissena polymorpha TaxID=45954 RepID=A0A9D4G8Q8_DREPO|nr:hypothetical protein DPMN_139264 [Dreissena polymorpha]
MNAAVFVLGELRSIKGPFIPSNGYWAGIKVEQNRLEVGEKDKPRTLVMYSTVPVVCPPPHDVTCHLDIDLDPINNNSVLDFYRQSDFEDFSEAPVHKDLELVDQSVGDYPGLRAWIDRDAAFQTGLRSGLDVADTTLPC